MVGLSFETRYINANSAKIRNPVICKWLTEYLRRSFRDNSGYLHYSRVVTEYYLVKGKFGRNSFNIFDNNGYVTCCSLRRFKKFCRRNRLNLLLINCIPDLL